MIPALTLVARFVEGLGTGLFVAAAMSYVNSHPDHERMSGYLMAMMNAGLVTGLVFSGWLVVRFTHSDTGIAVFTALVTLPAISSFLIAERIPSRQKVDKTIFFSITSNYRWLLYSTIILIGITGVLISLYPEFSDMAPDSIGIWIAVMSISTVLAVLIASRIPLPPVRAIQVSAILMAISILVSYLTPLGFIMIGILVGFVIISQMAFLSEIKGHQGIAMGLFSTSSYLGMAVLPFLTGLVAETAGFFWAYVTTAFLSMTVAATIGRCTCQRNSFS
jgi:MFS family permease